MLLKSLVSVKRVKAEGDGFWVFAEDPQDILRAVNRLNASLEDFCLESSAPLSGYRCILGVGNLLGVTTPDGEDYSGEEVVELKRIDQPMKAYIHRHDLSGSQAWCTSAFHDAVAATTQHLNFRRLEPFALDKDHPPTGDYFSIER